MEFEEGKGLPWPREVPANWPKVPCDVMYCRCAGIKGEWYRGVGPEPIDSRAKGTLYRLVEMRVGWPIQAFQFERTLVMKDPRGTIGWIMDDPTSIWVGGIEVPRELAKPDEPATEAPCIRRIPVRPIWLGLLSATALHVVTIMGLIALPQRMMRWARQRNGCCQTCGYDMSNLAGCPECGSEQILTRARRSLGQSI